MESRGGTTKVSLSSLGQAGVIVTQQADVGVSRERARRLRLRRVAVLLSPIALWVVVRAVLWPSHVVTLPHLSGSLMPYLPAVLLVLVLLAVMVGPLLGAGRSPHVLYRPSEIDTRFDDVRGLG